MIGSRSNGSPLSRARRAPLVVAERNGVLVAARPLGSGDLIADPFHRTAEIGELLALWGRRLREEEQATPRAGAA